MNKLFHTSYFNEKARFGLLRNNDMLVAELSTYSIYRSRSIYKEKKQVNRDFENEKRAYRSSRTLSDKVSSSYGTDKAQKTDMNRAYSRVHQVDTKVEPLAKQLAAKHLLLKKITEKGIGIGKDSENPCSFFG